MYEDHKESPVKLSPALECFRNIANACGNVIELCKILKKEYKAIVKIKELYLNPLNTENSEINLITQIHKEFELEQNMNDFSILALKTINKTKENYFKRKLLNLTDSFAEIRTTTEVLESFDVPIIAFFSYLYSPILPEIADILKYQLTDYKRKIELEPKTIYKSEAIDQTQFLTKKALIIAIG